MYIMFCPPAEAKYPFFQVQAHGLVCKSLQFVHIQKKCMLIRINSIDCLQMINASLNKSVMVVQYYVKYSGEIYKWMTKKAVSYLFSGAVVQCLSILRNFIQRSLSSGSAQVQILLADCRRFALVGFSDNGPNWK